MGRVAAVIYDHDGTLVDSLAVVVAATNAVLQARSLPMCPAQEIIKGMAYPTKPRMGLHARVDDFVIQGQLADEFYVEMHRIPHLCRLYAGVPELIAGVAARGLPQGLVSNNSGRFIRLAMAHLGLASSFAVLLGEEDAPAPKPDPRGARLAAERLGVAPEHCLFVGDSPADCDAAHGAGMRAIGVTWGIHDREEMSAMGFDVLIDRPEELLGLLD
jgi:N-acetyl-D-muramate 6-phosphate phosphatase